MIVNLPQAGLILELATKFAHVSWQPAIPGISQVLTQTN